MLFKEFCETVLSNDIIRIVDNIINGKQVKEPVAAYRFLLDNTSSSQPDWVNEVLNKEIDKFTETQRTRRE